MVVGKTPRLYFLDPESTFFIAKCVGLLCLCYFTVNICGLILSRCLMFVGERHLSSQEITFALLAHYVWPEVVAIPACNFGRGNCVQQMKGLAFSFFAWALRSLTWKP